jgi:tape measure domain-containing protein
MGFNMDAILRVKAQTSGQGDVQALNRTLKQAGPAAESSVGGVQRLNASLKTMGSIAGAIGLAAVTAQMVSFGRTALQAGDDMNLLQIRIRAITPSMAEVARVNELAGKAAGLYALSQYDATEALTNAYGQLKPLGVGLEQVKDMYIGLNNAAKLSGATTQDVSESMRQLTQGIGSTRLNGDELKSLMERMPAIGGAIVTAFNNIAKSKGLTLITKQRADALVAEVKSGEKRQTQAIEDATRNRIRNAEKESESMLREIAARYEEELRLLDRKYDKEEDLKQRKENEAYDNERQRLADRYDTIRTREQRFFEDQRELLQREQDKELSAYNGASESIIQEVKDRHKAEMREFEDKENARMKTLQRSEEKLAKEAETKFNEQKAIRQQQAEDQRRQAEDALKKRQRAEEEAIKDGNERKKQLIENGGKEEIAANKRMADELVKGIKSRTIATIGDLKRLGAEGRLTPQVVFEAMKELSKLKPPAPTELQQLTAALKDLNTEIGEELLPVLKPFITQITAALKVFTELPGPVKTTAVGLGMVGAAVATITTAAIAAGLAVAGATEAIRRMKQVAAGPSRPGPVDMLGVPDLTRKAPKPPAPPAPPRQLDLDLSGKPVQLELDTYVKPKPPPVAPPPKGMWKGFLDELAAVGRGLKSIAKEVGLLIASILVGSDKAVPALGKLAAALRFGVIITGVRTALTGLIAWVGATLVPAMVAFFSGPPGWITLAVAAVIAGVVLFREPIWKFLVWVGDTVKSWAGGFLGLFNDYVTKPLIGLWETIKTPINNLFTNISWLAGETFKMLGQIAYDFFVQPWVDLWEIVKEPVMATLTWIGDTMKTALNDLIAVSYIVFVEPWVQLWQKVKEPISSMLTWIKEAMGMAFEDLIAVSYIALVEPWVELWDKIRKPASDVLAKIGTLTKTIFNGIIKFLYEKFVKPWQDIWKFLTQSPEAFKKSVNQSITDAIDGIVQKYNDLAGWLSRPFRAAGNLIAGAFNTILRGATDLVNALSGKINTILAGVNNASRTINTALKTNLPVVQMIPSVEAYQIPIDKMQETLKKEIGIPPAQQINWPEPLKTPELDYSEITAAATGGWFGGPRIVKIGEGGDPGGEYAIPAQMMPAAMAAWNQGARGDALVSAMRSPGLAPGRSTTSPQSGGGGPRNLTINLQSGPVMQMADGSQWVQREELVALAEALMEATSDLNSSSAVRSVNGWG